MRAKLDLSSGVSAVALAALLAVAPDAAQGQLVASGHTLTVTTANATATFQGPDLAGLVNIATGEAYLKLPPSSPLMDLATIAGTGQALTASDWTTSVQNGTAVASLTMQDSVRSVTIAVSIDAQSQEIVIRLSGQAAQAGVTGASWGVAGLDLNAGHVIVPANTGVVFDREHPAWGTSVTYPHDWQAQMLVYETSAGSVVLYSTDPLYLFKQLRFATRGSSTLDLFISTQASGPWAGATSVPPVEWRLKAFAGDWRTAAGVYRDWLAAHRPRVARATDAWTQNVRAVVTLAYATDPAVLDNLAGTLTPSRTLVYLPSWRAAGYDVDYPDYTPAAGVAAFVAKAHALGFKVMLHTDLIGVTTSNPDFASVESAQVKDPSTLAGMGWQWDTPPTNPTRFAYIDPASSAYRNLFIARVGAAVAALQPDALHLDISAPMFNDGNGPIEGMSFPQGSVQLHKDLIAAFPNVALGGEGMNDVLHPFNAFAQAWTLLNPGNPPGHPILNFLWNSQGGSMRYYGHLSQPNASAPTFKGAVSTMERQGILPSLVIWGPSDLDPASADNARLFKWLQSWQANGFQPDWTGSWNGVVVPYKAAAGANATAALTDTGTLVSLGSGGTPIYQRAHDTVTLDTSSYVPNWPAFDSTRLYGLDPAAQYWLDPVARPSTTHVSSLPPGVRLGAQTMVSSSFALIELVPTAIYDFIANLGVAAVGTTENGIDGPLDFGATAQVTTATVGGVPRPGIFMHPPYKGHGGGETYVEWSLPVPPSAVFTFSVGVADNAGTCTDGVTFRVVVNGSEAWRQNVLHQGWVDGSVDLSAYSGTIVRLRIVTSPGPANNASCDWASFSALALSSTVAITTSVPLVLAPGAMPADFSGDGTFTSTGPGTAQVSNMPVPGQFALVLAPGSGVGAGTNLATLPFTTWLGGEAELPSPGSLYGSGSVSPATSGGITKQNAIFAHPPPDGRTILSWVLAIPASGDPQLSWSAALSDTAASCATGVRFEVRINGVVQSSLFQQSASGWSHGSADLSSWQGKNIVLQLVTDSVGPFYCDHGLWADLLVTPIALGNGTIAANPYGPMTVQGASLIGNTISNAQQDVVIQLGPTAGSAGSVAEIDFQGFQLATGNTLTIKSGAAGQTVLLSDKSGAASSVRGSIQAQGSGSIAPPRIYLRNPAGLTLASTGQVVAPGGLTIDTLGASASVGAQLRNDGLLDGGNSLALFAGAVHGGGEFRGNTILLSTFGNANNPVNGINYLANGLRVFPSSGAGTALTLNGYGTSPQVFNIMVNGNATVSMPSAWPNGTGLPANNPPVAAGGVRPAGTPQPAYGGGSMIIQASGSLALAGGASGDFAFPGAIILKAGGNLDLNGVLVNQGWTTTGQPFQGIFFESPNIVSPTGNIRAYGNNLNWVNFSTLPHAPVRTYSLVPNSDGSASFVPADATIPHLNTYSAITAVAVSGGCWICVVNPQPIEVYGP